ADELFQRLQVGLFLLEVSALVGSRGIAPQLLDSPHDCLEFFAQVAGYGYQVLNDLRLVAKLREGGLQRSLELAGRSHKPPAAPARSLAGPPCRVARVHTRIEFPDLLDQTPEFPEVPVSSGNFRFHDDAVEPFFRGLGEQLLGN